ncbi:MAG: phytoene/squalene synthase family protein [Planctomycetota bacterium]
MSVALSIDESIRHCRGITRRAATSFYYAFKTLPKTKRIGFEVVYAFMRLSDDISDDDVGSGRREKIHAWRICFDRALAGDTSSHPVMPALMKVLCDFDISPKYFHELIDGTEQDLDVTRFQTFEDLYSYCYQVASTVGLVSLRLFGLVDPNPSRWSEADALAIACGQGFQLTNILRDVKEDTERDRIYLPHEDLERFGINEDDLRAERYDEPFKNLMAFEAKRAQAFYDESAELMHFVAADARPCFRTMRGIYHSILLGIIARDYEIWSTRVRVPLPKKLGIAARAFLGFGS